LAAWSGSTWSPFESGTNGAVLQIVSFPDRAVVSGAFDSIEGASVPHLASWNGVEWSPVADSVLPGANPLGIFRGQLVVASSAVDGQIRHLEDGAWIPFGEGIPEGSVTSMTTYRSELIVGGHFDFIGHFGDAIHGVARWDGDQWRSIGAGVAGASWNSPVNAMAVYAGKLIVAGGLDTAGGSPCNAIASWDGNAWSTLGTGLSDPPGQVVVWALSVYKGELVATGQFQRAGGIAARNIARWNGMQWNALGAGGDSTLSSWGRALQVMDDELYVGGSFAQANGVEVHNIARWDGSSWSALDGGVTGQSLTTVNALGELDGKLLVGGSFVETGAGVSAFIARWATR
jgi:trimeric autotransporter adhesin